MPFPENPSEMTPELARDLLCEYEEAYDVVDSQGQFNSTQIHAQLQKKFFGTSGGLTLAKLRTIAERAPANESSLMVDKVADATVKIIEPRQSALFGMAPSETTEALRPKNEAQANYEDFEAAYGVQTAGGARPKEIAFKTVVGGVERQLAIPYVVAKTVMMPPKKGLRISILQENIWPKEYFE